MNRKHLNPILLLWTLLIWANTPTFAYTYNYASLPILEDPTEFSTEPAEFYEQIQEHLMKTKREDAEKAAVSFVQNAQSGGLTDDQINTIIANCNEMLTRRMRAYPHFTGYLNAINQLVTTGRAEEKFEEWHQITAFITQKTKRGQFRNFDRFITFSEDFFTNDFIYASKSKQWKVETIDYTFQQDGDSLWVFFEEATLMGITPKDTLAIYNTTGQYYPFSYQWNGQSGRVTWERVGLAPDVVYADIDAYAISMKKGNYMVEDVNFYHEKYFGKRPVQGKLRDQFSSKVNGSFRFPQFRSYETDLNMTNLADQIVFTGGFGLNGTKIIGFGGGDASQKASLDFYSTDDRLILQARANRFAIKPGEAINSVNTGVALYFAQDSIYHPNLNLNYKVDSKDLRLARDTKASGQIAFMSSYHQLEANVDAIIWNINQPFLNFKMVSTMKDIPVVFESFNLYEPARFHKYRTYKIDPLRELRNKTDGPGSQINAHEFARRISPNYTVASILSAIFDMVADGFIYYDPETDIITVREKINTYFKAERGKVDFDRIALISKVAAEDMESENAQLDLEQKELLVTGVKKVALSDSQKVKLFPSKGIIKLLKNRDMEMAGTILAGNLDLSGRKFKFDYDNFAVDLDSIEQVQLYLPPPKMDPSKVRDKDLVPIASIISDVKGKLYIDQPDNKSGRDVEKSKGYPKFETEGNSYVYYNNPNLYSGSYKKEDFYFEMEPFNFSDLDDIDAGMLDFNGKMVVGNIFPAFDQKLTLQEDNSLGFEKSTPDEGWMAYGKGNFTGTLKMNNKGLLGDGKMEYLAAVFAKQFVFLPDSMLSKADSFYLDRKTVGGVEFPRATNGAVNVSWIPEGDSMLVYMTDQEFTIFDTNFEKEQSSFRGNLLIQSTGLRGSGEMNWKDATIGAKDFAFTNSTFQADSSSVTIKNEDAARVAFNSFNVQSDVDMEQMIGNFKANEGEGIPIVLPYNMYKTTASEYFWLMNDNIINLRLPEDGDNFFESTHPNQGGLRFPAAGGVVDLNKNTLQIDGVPYISIADAKIVPDNTQLNIGANAQIEQLTNAIIVADTISENHKISKATVNIKNINEFEGSGEYRYKGKKMKKQKIFFDFVSSRKVEESADEEKKRKRKKDMVKENYYTYAAATISEEDEFKLNKRISFKGDVILDSRQEFLIFDGFAKLDMNTEALGADWFSIKDTIDPKNVQLDVTTPVGERTDTLLFGFAQDMDELTLYPAFLSSLHTPLDAPIFKATGSLSYDSKDDVYKIGSAQKIDDASSLGSLYTLYDETGQITAEGRFEFGNQLGLVDVDMAGTLTHDIHQNNFDFNHMVIGVDFFFPQELLSSIGESMRYFSAEGEEIDYTKPTFFSAAKELLDKEKVPKLQQMLQQYAYMPERIEGLKQPLLFTDVNMTWDTSSYSIRSVGKFGLSYAGEKYTNRMVNGFIELGMRRNGDFFNIYLETEPDGSEVTWYYFTYKNGVLEALSSDPKFNQKVAKEKEKKRIKEDKKRNLIYRYKLAPLPKRNSFVFRMQEAANPAPPITPEETIPVEELPTEELPAEELPTEELPAEESTPINEETGGQLPEQSPLEEEENQQPENQLPEPPKKD